MSIPGTRLRRLAWSFIVSFLPACFLVAPASAQEPASQPVEEITVTARKRAESLQDVPATVTVFTEDRIERSNINRAGDIALLTPGVSLVDAAEVGDTQVNIRGMNGDFIQTTMNFSASFLPRCRMRNSSSNGSK